jgi:hypothetical protein
VPLFGIGAKALLSWDSKTRWNNLLGGLAVSLTASKRTCELTSSIVPRGTSFHRSVELECPPIGFDPARFFMLLTLGVLLIIGYLVYAALSEGMFNRRR